MSAICIRPAREADAPAMAAYLAGLAAEGLDVISPPPDLDPADQRERVFRAAAAGRALILLAVADEAVVGMVELWGGEGEAFRHAGWLSLSVAAAWRGQGVGGRLLAAATAEAQAWSGFTRIELEVTPRNIAAVRLYEAAGFVIEGRKRRAIRLRAAPEDLLVMARVW